MLDRESIEQHLQDLQKIDFIRDQRVKQKGYKYYSPNKRQLQAHKSIAKKILFCGGNRSGKSTFGAAELAYHLSGDYPDYFPEERKFNRPIKLAIVSTENPIIQKVIEPKLKQYLPHDMIPRNGWKRVSGGFLQRVLCKNRFGGHNPIDILTNEQDDMAFEGQDWDVVWVDEPIGKRKYQALERGLVDRGGWMIFTFTPLIEPWMKDELVDKSDGKEIDFIQVDMRDNKETIDGKAILSEDNIKRFEAALPEDVRETRVHGKFFHLRGIVYKEFSNIHCRTDFHYEPGLPVICTLDPHDRQPHHVIWAFVDKINDLYVDNEIVMPGTTSELAQIIKKLERVHRYSVKRRIIDPNFGKKPLLTTGLTVIQELGKAGCPGWIPGLDKIEEGHFKVKQYIHFDRTKPIDINNCPKMFFHKDRCPATIHSMRNHQYMDWQGKLKDDRDPKEKPKPKDTHGADCVRYLCMSNPKYERFRRRNYELADAPY